MVEGPNLVREMGARIQHTRLHSVKKSNIIQRKGQKLIRKKAEKDHIGLCESGELILRRRRKKLSKKCGLQKQTNYLLFPKKKQGSN